MGTGIGTGTGRERVGQCGWNMTGNGGREGPAQAGRQRSKEDEKTYVGRGYEFVLGGLCGLRGRIPILFGTYNIHNGQNGGPDLALRGMSQANMNLVIFQEKKLTVGVYTCRSSGYSIVSMYALIRPRGGVAVF